jgi:peroxiredoxin
MIRNLSAIFFAILMVIVSTETAHALRIEGFEPDYAGRTIEFYTLSDPVSKTSRSAFTLRIGPQGRIQVNTGIDDKMFCYADFDSYRGRLIAIPGDTIKIKLPPLKPKSFEESKNPYFKPIELWIMNHSADNSDPTSLFARFDQDFYQLNEKYFEPLFFRRQRNYIDSVRLPLETEYKEINQPWLKFHQQFMIANLEAGLIRTGREKLMAGLQSLPSWSWSLNSFGDLMDNLFSNTLSIESKTKNGEKIRMWISQRNLPELKKWLEKYSGTTSSMADLLLLKMLHDAFYSGEFSKTALLHMIKAESFTGHTEPYIRNTARNVSEKLLFLYPGTQAPDICLPLLTGEPYCSSKSEARYQYILFADLEIPVCQEQVKYLSTMTENTGADTGILVVLSPSGRIDNQQFIQTHKIPGTIVTDTGDNEYGKRYRIRSYPTAFLLDSGHRVVLAPAKTPLDGFEYQLKELK